MGQLVVREVGFMPPSNTVELSVRFLSATPLHTPVIVACRLTTADGPPQRVNTTECVAWRSDDFFALPKPLNDCWVLRNTQADVDAAKSFGDSALRPLFHGTALWKRPNPQKVGMQRLMDYSDFLDMVHGRGGDDDGEDDNEEEEKDGDDGGHGEGGSDVQTSHASESRSRL